LILTQSKKFNKKAKDGNNGEKVLTPGGYRPRKNVQSVGPNEAVYIDESGNHIIVPKKDLEKDNESSSAK
jgi:hypothetical protein